MAWIFERNLGAWCDAVSVLFGTALTDAEWEAIRRGVLSSRTDGAFRYLLGGPDGIEVTAQLDDPPDLVLLGIPANSHDGKIETITLMCRLFTIQGRVRRHEMRGPNLSPGAGAI